MVPGPSGRVVCLPLTELCEERRQMEGSCVFETAVSRGPAGSEDFPQFPVLLVFVILSPF